MPHNITDAPHIITDDSSTEDSEGYTQLLQSHNIQFNNIMNSDNENLDNNDIDSPAEEVSEALVLENPSCHLKMNGEVDLEPHYIHGLWTQSMKLAEINLIDTNSSQPVTQQEDCGMLLTSVTALSRPPTDLT